MPRHKLVHIIPIPGVSIRGVPAVEQDVTEEEWRRLAEYQPPAFTRDPLPPVQDKRPKEGK